MRTKPSLLAFYACSVRFCRRRLLQIYSKKTRITFVCCTSRISDGSLLAARLSSNQRVTNNGNLPPDLAARKKESTSLICPTRRERLEWKITIIVAPIDNGIFLNDLPVVKYNRRRRRRRALKLERLKKKFLSNSMNRLVIDHTGSRRRYCLKMR